MTKLPSRVLTFLGLSAAVGCGLTFSPGDYSGPDEARDASSSNDVATSDANALGDGKSPAETSTSETGPAGPALRVLVFSEAGDVWTVPAAINGDLGAFQYLQSTPLAHALTMVGFAGGKVLTVHPGTSNRVVQMADFNAGLTSGWKTTTVANPGTTSFGTFLAKSSVIGVGGQTTAEVDDGTGMGTTTTVTTNHAELFVSKVVDGGAYSAPGTSTTKLLAPSVNANAVVYKDFVYLYADGLAASKVYVGKIDESLGLSTVAETEPLAQGGTPYAPSQAIACAGEGRLFLAGGTNQKHTLTASIDEATGKLGAWKSGPELPASLTGAGCAVVKGSLYLYGGRVGDSAGGQTAPASDQILRSRFQVDGTMAEWEKTAQKLPGARAKVLALTY